MKIFDAHDLKPQYSAKDGKSIDTKSADRSRRKRGKSSTQQVERVRLSPQEVREKIANFQKSRKKVAVVQDKPAKQVKKENPDLNLNDPQSPLTIQKLKDSLGNGMVNFSDRERKILDQIINER